MAWRRCWVKCLPPPGRPVPELQSQGRPSGPAVQCRRDAARGRRRAAGARGGRRCRPSPPDRTGERLGQIARAVRCSRCLLPDGRWVLARWHRHHRAWGWLGALLLLAAAIAIGAYPVVRRITGRLERLQARVDALGAGRLASARAGGRAATRWRSWRAASIARRIASSVW